MVEIIRTDAISIPSDLRGSQMPRLWTAPPRHIEPEEGCSSCARTHRKEAGCGNTLGLDALDWAKGVGYTLFDWQKWQLVNALGTKPDGMFSAMEVALIVSRQNGKGTCLEVRELFGMFGLRERLIIHTAHELKTAKEHFLRCVSVIDANPGLSRRLKGKPRLTNGQESIETKAEPTLIMGSDGKRIRKREGTRMMFVARSRGSARGFTADLLVYDEAMILSTESVGASLPTLSTRENPQIWFTGSAGLEDSFQLAKSRSRIVKDEKTLFGAEWSINPHKETCPKDRELGRAANHFVHNCPDPTHDDRDDPRSWAKANPTFGKRPQGLISGEYIRDMEFYSMDDVEFDRERLSVGQWPIEDEAWAVIPEDLWETLTVAVKERGKQCALAVDVDKSTMNATVSFAHYTGGKIVVENMKGQPGTEWVVDKMKDWDRKYKPLAVIVPRSGAAAGLGDDIEKCWPDNPKWGTKVIRATVSDEAAAYSWFVQQCKSESKPIGHRAREKAERMYSAIGNADTRDVGDGGKALSRNNSGADISPITSAILAGWGLNRKRRNYDPVRSIA
jgi:hypothetical protein